MEFSMAQHKWVEVRSGVFRRVKVLSKAEQARHHHRVSCQDRECRIATFATKVTLEHAFDQPRTFQNIPEARRELKKAGLYSKDFS
jgi:hypothetical protein